MQSNRCTSCTYHHLSGIYKTSVFKNAYLVVENIIQAFFFAIIKSPYAPAKAKLVDECFFFTENKQRHSWPVAAEHKSCVAALRHAYQCIRIYIQCNVAGTVTQSIT